jgi:hypothetical protein
MSARCILCFFAPLAFLSGCQQIPYSGGPAPVDAKKADASAVAKPADPQSSPGVSTVVKSPVAPLPVVEGQSSGPVFDPALLKSGAPKKSAQGVPGLVVIEEPTQALPAKATQADKNDRKFEPAVIALQYVLDNRPDEALKLLQKYDKSTQEFFLNWMPAVAIILRSPIEQMSAQEIEVFNQLFSRGSQTVRNYTELVISKMCFCRRIQSFGAYDPLPVDHAFLSRPAGRYGDLVQVYVELKNFVSDQVKEGDYVTKLACSLEIKNSRGERVKVHGDKEVLQFNREETTHHCRSRMNDLHENFSFPVPAMPPGTYLLTMQIVDETLPSHRRVAQQSLSFRVTPVASDEPQR